MSTIENSTHSKAFAQVVHFLQTRYSHLCPPLPILSLSGVDRHDCLLPSFSVVCEVCVELVLFHIALHSVHPPQFGHSSGSIPSHLHCCYLLCNVRVFSSHHMAIPRNTFMSDTCGHWLESILASSSRLCASFAALLCVVPNNHCHISESV